MHVLFTCYDANSMYMCCSRAMTSILCAFDVHVLFMRHDVIVGIPLNAIWGGVIYFDHSITWNRFVNTKGHKNSNYPMDLSVEHDNKNFKTDIHSYQGEITEKCITTLSRSLEATDDIL